MTGGFLEWRQAGRWKDDEPDGFSELLLPPELSGSEWKMVRCGYGRVRVWFCMVLGRLVGSPILDQHQHLVCDLRNTILSVGGWRTLGVFEERWGWAAGLSRIWCLSKYSSEVCS